MTAGLNWLGRIRRYWSGWVSVELTGWRLERVLSRLTNWDVHLWDLRRHENTVRFRMPLEAVPTLREALAGQRIRLRFGHRGGMPFQWTRLKGRPGLGAGALTAILILAYLSGRVWLIRYPDVGALNAALVEAATRAGLFTGTNQRTFSRQAAAASIEQQLAGKFSWVGVDLHGVLATVQAVPQIPKPAPRIYSRLVASASGTVTGLQVYMGSAEVTVGTKVKAGQLLISGVLRSTAPPAKEGGAPTEQIIETPAKGDVWAEVLYSATVFEPYARTIQVPTGQSLTLYDVRISQTGWDPLSWFRPPFPQYTETVSVHPLAFRGIPIPAQWMRIVYNESRKEQVRVTEPEAVREAEQHLAVQLAGQLAARHVGTQAVVKRQHTVQAMAQGVKVTERWTAVEQIAVPPTSSPS